MSFAVPFVVPALCLTGLWGYTATGLVDEQMQLGADMDRVVSVGQPAHGVLSSLQDERRLTAVWQAERTPSSRAVLDSARDRTDAAVEDYRRASPSGLDTAALRSRATKLDEALGKLAERRKAIDARSLSVGDAFEYFTDTVADAASVLSAATRTGDGAFASSVAAAASLVQVTEMLSREDAMISGALPSGRMAAAERTRFGQYTAVRRQAADSLHAPDLLSGGAGSYEAITDSPRWKALASTEDAVAADSELPEDATTWPDDAGSVVKDLQELNAAFLEDLAGAGSDRADGLLLGVVLGSAGTAAALALVGVLALRVRRSVLGRVEELQHKAEDLAGTRLPEALARLERGEPVDPAALTAPGQQRTGDELGRLDAAIEQLARAAADTAVRQSLGREGTEKVFAKLIRRTQTLIHRLISLLDDLERKHEDSDLLKDIFRVDHLATRVRRHSENLVILGGSPPTRRMTAPVSITDVMRSAVAETEHYTRVKVKNLPPGRRISIAGRSVADVTHLLAELIENGTNFSPPDTQVFVSATKVARGLALHVEDHGLGMPEEHRARANRLLANPPKLDMMTLGEDPRLGHFVVARLAERHKIKVELRESVYGGTLAIVLVPTALLEEQDSPLMEHLKSAAEEPEPSAAPAAPAVPALHAEVAEPAAPAAGAATAVRDRPHDPQGYPEYGGAGLLPAVSAHPPASGSGRAPAAPAPVRTPAPAPAPEWSPPQEHPDPEAASPGFMDHGDPRAGSAPLTTPRVLPQRTRGASLAQQLRKEAAQAQGEEADGESGGLSPGESARTMMAIQQGMKRARISDTDESAGADGQAQSPDRSAN
ncbi:nitrate- and nitrite sensing domain-containing protein [Streptomyces peucetius]|uniref:histidine kinase n=1 Tax=Streptomyces peucetius TaxID=1950 RepID=A0ABY6IGC9_STRPE|nr:nitrate- and nitrite sensing domain-containing protein [Streptomyces peucetius]UYQ66073.1 nitrate- and nitrite sensing domain-containing protein [Streptomyces peucetius]